MKKTYMILLGLVLSVVGASSAMAQKIYQAELDASMFKAWTGWEAGATVVEEPEAIDDGAATFNCENNLYRQLEGGNVVFGNTNVYYLWYADLTGTKTFYAEGTPGLQLRVLMNRPAPEEGGTDAHGGKTLERMLVIGDDGKGSIDVSDLEYLHLNCIKVNWGGSGIVKAFYMEGTVKPVTGLLSMINNGDAEGTDLSSFPVSHNGGVEGVDKNAAEDFPEIVDGGVSGKCLKVVSDADPVQTWGTQFFIKADEVMPKGTKWQLKMAIKAERACTVTTSAQGTPRAWKGNMGIDEFTVTEEWKNYTWEGEIGVDDFQSIAFDLNNEGGSPGNASNAFFFDNIEFGIDLGGSNPLSNVKISAGYDVIQVDLAGMTNMKELVNNALTQTLIFDNSCATVTVDGKACEILSVEGFKDGNLYIFLAESAPLVEGEENVVKVGFKNPTDAEHQLLFTAGKFEGQPVPEFSGLEATFLESLGDGEYVSYLWGAPMVAEVSPEAGSFNLPADFNQFVVTFNQNVKVSSIVAKLGTETLTASADGELAKVIKLTRTSNEALKGSKELVISQAWGEKGPDYGLEEDIVIKYGFGPVASDEEPAVIYASNFTGEGDDANGAGWMVTADNQAGLQAANSGSGNRLQHGQTGYAADVLYLAQRSAAAGIALYGTVDGYKLELQGGTTYHLTLKSAQWDAYPTTGSNRTLRAQILTEDAVSAGEEGDGSIIDEDGILAEEFKVVDGRVKEDKEFTSFDIAFTPATTGNYVIRLVAGNLDGNPAGYGDGNAIADVKIEFIPDVLGIVETKNLKEALQTAKDAYDEIAIASSENDDRYAGEDLTALDNLIKEVEANMGSYTAPSLYVAKTDELKAAVKAANDHKSACDAYDTNIKTAVDIVADKAESKFNATKVYADLKAITAKYHASKTRTNLGDDEDPIWEEEYVFDLLKDTAALAEASAELTAAVNVGNSYFTEVALTADIQQGNCGAAVLVERNRLGARTLLSLGVDENETLIDAVKNSIDDNDLLAEAIKLNIKKNLYEQLANADNDVFGLDDETGEAKTVDMTAFIKNPNIYITDGTQDISEETVPGWIYPEGYSKPGLFKKWDPQRNIAGLPEDCAFTTYFGAARMEQTSDDLPAGIYLVTLCGSDWSNRAGRTDGDPYDVAGFVYCKTSDTPAVGEEEEEDRDVNFAATRTIVYGGQYNMDHALNLGIEEVLDDETGFIKTSDDPDAEVTGITVTDGKLTIGMNFANDAQYFFQHARLTMIAPAPGFDYAAALAKVNDEIAQGIEAQATTAKVRAIEIYDLNGSRIISSKKGIQIVKKHMSDGTVRVEKVIKK